MKYSIVIPTYNHCDDLLKPCVEAIVKYTTLADIELIIIANGCTDETLDYLQYLDGFFKRRDIGDFKWKFDPNLLESPFNEDPKCGISCVVKGLSEAANAWFAVFFCVMIDRKVFDSIGLLNEEYGKGGGEDTEFCIEAERAGFSVRNCLDLHWADDKEICTGGFPIYHQGEGTVLDRMLVPDWNDVFYQNGLKLAKKYNPEWYRFKLSNNYERAVFLSGDIVFPCETKRYQWAANNILGKSVFEIGCSTGYGVQFLPKDVVYTGLDYDPIIVGVAKEQDWGHNCTFTNADVNQYDLGQYDTIIAFEVIEHLDNGFELVERLKNHCKRLLITVPYMEPKGFWGEHHKIHMINESHLNGFKFQYINEAGDILDAPANIDDVNRYNLMICRWDAE